MSSESAIELSFMELKHSYTTVGRAKSEKKPTGIERRTNVIYRGTRAVVLLQPADSKQRAGCWRPPAHKNIHQCRSCDVARPHPDNTESLWLYIAFAHSKEYESGRIGCPELFRYVGLL